MDLGLTNERLELIERLAKKYYYKDINIRMRMEYEDFFNSVIVKLIQPSPKNNGLNVLQLFDERKGTAIASYLSSIINRYTIDISRAKAVPASLDAIPDVHEFMEQLSVAGDIDEIMKSDDFDYIDNEPMDFEFTLETSPSIHKTIKASFRIIANLLSNGYRHSDLLRAASDPSKYRSSYKELKYFLESRLLNG